MHTVLRVEDNFELDMASKLGEVSANDIIKYMSIEKANLELNAFHETEIFDNFTKVPERFTRP
jgi:hypothetical protein